MQIGPGGGSAQRLAEGWLVGEYSVVERHAVTIRRHVPNAYAALVIREALWVVILR